MKLYIKLRIFYIKQLLKIYKYLESILPKFSNKLKIHIEKVSLNSSKLINKKILKDQNC
ncbi:hypothetical protein [Paraclostridium sordellii]|uniref:hypothetical protein n=1 Tax=Paraclostridium sordellii TaxID=1505 RepID=UPI0005E653CE|nr:hypothetical protein [Paeniclostridium sordellii]MDU1456263.1 hypothetical protein [Paeniclostridium sordellii]CEP83962.1 Uncharacterised protein [[Clostridium] sordellii] [Paeniclostridium sordellii]